MAYWEEIGAEECCVYPPASASTILAVQKTFKALFASGETGFIPDNPVCQRCGGDVTWEDCENCNEGYTEEDSDSGLFEHTCEVCEGTGGKYGCAESASYCQNNPMPWCEGKARGV